MSSTNRGGKRSEADYYPTPAWAVRRLLEAVELPHGRWLEPCAGDGAIIRAAEDHAQRADPRGWSGTHGPWTAVELREECYDSLAASGADSIHIRNFMEWGGQQLLLDGRKKYAVAITNLPFSLAMEVIHTCREIADHVIMLLRLNFLGSEERSKFIRETQPDIYVLPNRPSFCVNKHGKPATDSIEYMWAHWHANSQGIYRILASTPKEERR